LTPEEIIQTVHEIDRLEEQKRQRTADLDAKIAVLKERLSPGQATSVEQKSGQRAVTKVAPMGKASPKKQVVVEHILANPQADYDSLVLAVYGENTKRASDAAHSLIFDMKKRGVISGDPGTWRIVNVSPMTPAAGGARRNGINAR
jgi:hypothetical protein